MIMSIITQAYADYLEKYERAPEIVAINLDTYEKLLNETDTYASGGNPKLYGAAVIVANALDTPCLFFDIHDLDNALSALERNPYPTQHIAVRKQMPSKAIPVPSNSSVRAVVPDWTLETIQVPTLVVAAYRDYLKLS